MILRTIVVDDEQLAREELSFQLQRVVGVEVVAEASNGMDALRVIAEHDPDLLFLDVQMPGLSGFQVARRLVAQGRQVRVVFVTAYDQYALEAFTVSAIDYLLKPVEPRRLEQAVERARQRVAADRPKTDDLDRLLRRLEERQERRDQVAVRVGERFLLIQAEEIVHASLADDQITVVTNTVSGTSNYRSLDELQARLDPEVFWRVHRSHLVNIQKIKEIVPWFSRNYILKMKDPKGTEIPVSRTQTKRLREYLKL